MLTLALAGGPLQPLRRLLDQHGNSSAALAAGAASWQAAGCTPAQRQALARPDAEVWARATTWLQADTHHLIGWRDPDYPPLLRDSPNPPLALFIAGDPTRL